MEQTKQERQGHTISELFMSMSAVRCERFSAVLYGSENTRQMTVPRCVWQQ